MSTPSGGALGAAFTSRLAVAIFTDRLALLFFLLERLVVDLHFGLVAQSPQHAIASRDDLIAFVQALHHFDIGCPGDTGANFHKLGLVATNHEDTLQFLLVFLLLGFRYRSRSSGLRRSLGV